MSHPVTQEFVARSTRVYYHRPCAEADPCLPMLARVLGCQVVPVERSAQSPCPRCDPPPRHLGQCRRRSRCARRARTLQPVPLARSACVVPTYARQALRCRSSSCTPARWALRLHFVCPPLRTFSLCTGTIDSTILVLLIVLY